MAEARSLTQRMADAAAAVAASRGRAGPVTAPMPLSSPMPLTPLTPPAGRARPAVATLPPAVQPAHGNWQVSAAPGADVVLMPGQMHIGPHAGSLRTLLGSCVAITLWHPERRIGGMCHYLLPSRTRRSSEPLDGRYGDEAVTAMVQVLRRLGTEPQEYHAHLYGGADTMPEGSGLKFAIGERNIEQGWSLVDQHGFQLQGIDVGDDVPRVVTLTLSSGQVDMRRGQGKAPIFNAR